MSDIRNRGGFVAVIAANVKQRETRRQLAANQMRKAVRSTTSSLVGRVPALWGEFGTVMLAALIGCWVISWLLKVVAGIPSIYTLATLGLFYSGQSTYHKYRLQVDPNYQVPRCRCARRESDQTEAVLRHRASSIAGIPNSLLGAILYATLIGLRATSHLGAVLPLAVIAVLVGGYLSYVMLFRIRALCLTCVSLSAINVLILVTAVL